MKNFKVFIGGPITHLSNGSANSKHQSLFNNLYDTLNTICTIYSAHIVENFGEVIFDPCEITTRDFKWIEEADLLLFILPDCFESHLPVRTDGTFIEIGYAAALKKETVIFASCIQKHSPMMQGLIDKMPWSLYPFSSSEEVIKKASELVKNYKSKLNV